MIAPRAYDGPTVARRRRERSRRRAFRSAGERTELEFGTVWINDPLPMASEMPCGGYKQSGYGKDLSLHALEDYTQVKHVMAKL